MTQTKAATVVSAIVNAGYQAHAFQRPDGIWVVRAKSNAIDVDVAAAHNLATNQAVSGFLAEIEYV